MSRDFPALVDPWSMVKARRGFAGSWPVARFERLRGLLADDQGEVRFRLQFDEDAVGTPFVSVLVAGDLWLLCQRTLEPYQERVEHEVLLGLLGDEAQEAALPGGYEPLVVGDEPLKLMDVVEDELILALPLVPKSDRDLPEAVQDSAPAEQEQGENAFAVLARLRRNGEPD